MTQRNVIILVPLLALTVAASTAGADQLLVETDNNSFSIYGFFKLDGTYQDHEMNSRVAPRFVLSDSPEHDQESTCLTAMHSRFGGKWKGPKVFGNTTISGRYEFDLFDSSSRNQMRIRTRLAFLELRGENYSVIAGQHWDIFGGGYPKTLLTNGYYWQTGNLGFRRAQLRYTRFFSFGDLAFSLADPTTDAGISSGVPLMSSRFGFAAGSNAKLGVSAIFGREEVDDQHVDIRGLSFDFKVMMAAGLTVMGELSTGENLKVALSRAGRRFNEERQRHEGVEVRSGWLELIYAADSFEGYLGTACEDLTEDELLGSGELGQNSAFFLGLVHKLGFGVSYGLEYTRFRGTYEDVGDADANQVNLAVMYTF